MQLSVNLGAPAMAQLQSFSQFCVGNCHELGMRMSGDLRAKSPRSANVKFDAHYTGSHLGVGVRFLRV